MGQNNRVIDRFEYHVEDLRCCDCLYYRKKRDRENKKLGCGEELCRYTAILVTAIVNGNINRKKGYFKIWDESPGSR